VDSLTCWLLDHYGSEKFHPGLERSARALAPLKGAFKSTKIVTIAGTNGKGETTLRLSRRLAAHKHCLWTSPHIQRITERFRSEQGEIPLEELQTLIEACHEQVLSQKLELSYYEFLFFVFCTWASRRETEFLLLEVGLGGRLDAVNVFDADMVLLPSISRDHQEFLGNRYDLILKEKLAVLRPHSLLISHLDLAYLKERATIIVGNLGGRMIDLEEFQSIPSYKFSQRNQFLAYAAYMSLTGKDNSYEDWNAEEEFLEYRGEVLVSGAEWTFFGSHNLDGLRKLIQFLRTQNYTFTRPTFDAVIIALSQRPQQDLMVMLKMIKSSGIKKILVTFFNHPKAASRETMESLASQEGLEFVRDIDSYVQGTNSGKILVTGSYYFLGHFKSFLCS
jgi:dihydrofolate synthase / folylpolyglutamate synthase